MSSAIVAYLDPGSGSVILQVIVGGIAAAGVTARLWWRRATSVFRRKPAEDAPDPEAR